jgi:hypothetical protein
MTGSFIDNSNRLSFFNKILSSPKVSFTP